MRQQRMLREELREKKKALEDMMRKDHPPKQNSRNQDTQSDNVSYSNKSDMFGWDSNFSFSSRCVMIVSFTFVFCVLNWFVTYTTLIAHSASASEDVTMATWGGSTAGNLESIEENENRSNDDEDDEDRKDDEDDDDDDDGSFCSLSWS